jgi:hypothetical protein
MSLLKRMTRIGAINFEEALKISLLIESKALAFPFFRLLITNRTSDNDIYFSKISQGVLS